MKMSAAYAIMLLSVFITSSAQRSTINDQFKIVEKQVKEIPLLEEAEFCSERVTSSLLGKCNTATNLFKNNPAATSLATKELSKRCCSGDMFESRKMCMCLVQGTLAESGESIEAAAKKRILKALDDVTANFATMCSNPSLLQPDCSAEVKQTFEFLTIDRYLNSPSTTCDDTVVQITKPCSSAIIDNKNHFCCKVLKEFQGGSCFCAGIEGFSEVLSDKNVSNFLETIIDPKSEISRQCGFVANQNCD